MSLTVWHHRPMWYLVFLIERLIMGGACWCFDHWHFSGHPTSAKCWAVLKSGCRSVRLSLKLLASCTSPGQQLPPKLEAVLCLSARLKSGTARTPEDACTDPKSPRFFPGLDWGTGLHPCLGMWNYVPADVVLPFIGNCVCASDNCTKMAEFGVGKRQDLPSRAAEPSAWREHFILAVCRKISFFMSRSWFILSLSSWGLRVPLSVLESVEAQLTASCALLLSSSQMPRDSLQGGSTDSQMRISWTFPWWEVSLGLS